jgi:hypothetical protein
MVLEHYTTYLATSSILYVNTFIWSLIINHTVLYIQIINTTHMLTGSINMPKSANKVPIIRELNAGKKNLRDGNGRCQKCLRPVRVVYSVECPDTSNFKKITVYMTAIDTPLISSMYNRIKDDNKPVIPSTVDIVIVSRKFQCTGFSLISALSYAIAITGMSFNRASNTIIMAGIGAKPKINTDKLIKNTMRIVSAILNVA